jgi:hypothetical protein
MRRKLTFAVVSLALTAAALVSGARPAQASLGDCTNYYCPDGISIAYTCCVYGGTQYVCSLEVPCN